MSTTVKVLSAKETLASYTIQKGDVLVVQAKGEVNYQLIDNATGYAPQNILAKRDGKNLVITLDEGNTDPDIIIENYYADDNVNSMIIGLHENGNIYAYVPESGQTADAVSMLAEEMVKPQALGGEELSSFLWAFNPWWLAGAAAVIGGVALAAGGSSSGSKGESAPANNTGTTPTTINAPAQPVAVADPSNLTEAEKQAVKNAIKSANPNLNLTDDQIVVSDNGTATVTPTGQTPTTFTPAQVSQAASTEIAAPTVDTVTENPDGTNTITGKATPGASVQPKDEQGNPIGEPVTADEEGNYTATVPAGTTPAEVTQTVGGVESAPAEVDTTAPQAPTVDDVATDDKATTISGTAEPNATVEIKDKDGNVVGTAKADDKGNYTVTTDKPLADGEYDVVAKDEAGNESTPAPAEVDTTAPQAPTVGDVATDDKATTISGTAEPNATVEVKDKDGNVVGTATADDKGNYTVTTDKPLADGEYDVVAKDEAGNESAPAPAEVDTTAPQAPTVGDVATDDKATTISGTAEPNATVEVKDKDGNVVGTATADDKGNYTVTTDKPLADGEYDVVAKDEAGNESAPAPAEVDTTAPQAPTVGDVATDDKATTISGTAEPNATVEVKDKDGNVVGTATADDKGNYTVTTDKPLADGEYDVVAKDEAGNESAPAPAEVDTTAPQAPTVGDVATDDKATTISGTAEPNATVEIKDKDGNVVGTAKADDKGNYTVTTDKPLADGEYDVVAKDEAGNESAPAPAEVDTTAPEQPKVLELTAETDGTTVKGTTEPNATVEVKDKDGNVVGTVTADDKGNFEVPVKPALTAGETYQVTATDDKGNESEPKTITGGQTDFTAPDAPVVTDVVDNGDNTNTVKGTAEPNATVQIKDENGNVIGTTTADDKGNFEVKVPALEDGKEYDVTAADAAGNESTPDVIDLKAPQAPTVDDVATDDKATTISGTAEPNATVEVKDKDGNVVGTATADDKGNYTVTTDKPLVDGEYDVVAKDEAGNESAPAPAAVDTTAPQSNDADNDGKADDAENTAKQAVTDAVQAAKDAETAYNEAKAAAEADGIISPEEAQDLADKAQAVETKKNDAQALIEALPTAIGTTDSDNAFKEEQQQALNAVTVPVAPQSNDADNDGKADDAENTAKQAVTDAVQAAKDAETAYNEAKAAAEADGIISPEEAQDLADKAQAVETKKNDAQALIDALPTAIGTTDSDNAFKEEQQNALNAVTVPVAPQSNDADNDGKADDAEDTAKQAVTDAVNAAKAAEAAYNEAKAAAEADGIISPQEAQDLATAAQAVQTKKDEAQTLIDALPTAIGTTDSDNAFKEEQQNALNAVTVPVAPQSNDADNDGKADDAEDTAKQAVTDAVNAAKAAEAAYNEAKAAAEADGIISPQEAQDLATAAQAVQTKKDEAQTLIDALPTAIGTTDSDNAFKEEQQNALNAVTVPVAPQSNDADNDGKADDAEDTAKQAVTDAVNAAKAAEAAYNEAKAAAEADGIISPQEAQDLATAAQAVQTKKDEAQTLIDALPTAIGTTDSDNAFKEEQQNALNAVTVPVAPQSNDADNDGKADDAEDTAKQAVTDAVNAAKAAEAAYNEAKAAAEADGIISPQEAQELATAAQAVQTKKNDAQNLIDALPTAIGTTESDNAFKEEQQNALNAVTVPVAPQSNDADNDGKADDAEDTAKQAVTDAVNAAKAAEAAYNEAKAAAEADGIISPQEAQDLATAAQAVQTKKDEAQTLIDALPTAIGTTDSDNAFKEEQQNALNAVTVPVAPQSNDADNDGKADDAEDTAKQAVTNAVNAAKAAEEAYNTAKTAAEADGIISPEEAQDLADKAQAVQTKKDDAQNLINALPTAIGTTDSDNAFKDEQQQALNAVTVPVAPQSNDADNDGKADDAEDTAKQAVTNAVNAAKAAEEAYNTAKTAAEADGIISPEEAQDLADKAQAVQTKKDDAQNLINALPTAIGTTDSDNAFKDEQQQALNAVTVPVAPQSNDADNDGKADDAEDTAKQAVTNAVNAAKAAEEAYNTAKTAAEADGIISPEEAQDLADKAQAVQTKKDDAQNLINALPTAIGTTDSDNAFKDEQQQALNAVTVPVAPQSNDADNDGKADDAEDTAKQAVTNAVNAAKAAEEAYNTAKTAAEADGIISPEEAQDLADKAQAVQTKKDDAQNLINALPTAIGTTDSDNAFKDEQQNALNAVTVPVAPQTNDADNDGKADDAEDTAKQAVTDAVNAAKAAEAAYNEAKAAAEADGIISPQEAQDLATAAQAVQTKKDEAQTLIDALPTAIGTTDSDNAFKEEQQNALNAVTVPVAPQSNDADDDGITDTAENNAIKLADDKVKAAEAAKTLYDNALTAAQADGIISRSEAEDLATKAETLNNAIEAAKTEVEGLSPAKIGAQPGDVSKEKELNDRIPEEVTPPVVPPQTSFKLGDNPYDLATLGSMTASVDNSDDVAVGATWAVTYVSKVTGGAVTLNLTKGANGWALDPGQTAEDGVSVNGNGTIVFKKGSLEDTTELTSVVTSGTETDTAATRAPITGSGISTTEPRQGTLYDDGTEGANNNYDDVIVIDTTVRDQRGTPINTGRGDDVIVVGNKDNTGETGLINTVVNMGDGDDTLIVFDRLRNAQVDMGEGNNHLSIGTMTRGATITAGSGDDVLEFTAQARTNNRHIIGTDGSARIDLGDGSNTVDASKSATGVNIRADIITGSGNDTFELSNSILQPANSSGSTTPGYIHSGAGNDVVSLGGTGSLINATPNASERIDAVKNVGHGVDLGAGDDILNFTPVYSRGGISNEFMGTYETGEFKGGEGFDKLVIGFNPETLNTERGSTSSTRGYHTDNEFKFNLYLASGFEEIDMSHSGKHTLNNVIELNAATSVQYNTQPTHVALGQNQGTIGDTGRTGLLVKGNAEDKVDLAGKGNDLKQADTLSYEGVTYDHYEFNGNHIYIQQGVQVI